MCQDCDRQKPPKDPGGYFPPPWNMYDFPEKTEGWISFQDAMKNDPSYYKFNDHQKPPKDPQTYDTNKEKNDA